MIELKITGSANEVLAELQQLGFGRIQLAWMQVEKAAGVTEANEVPKELLSRYEMSPPVDGDRFEGPVEVHPAGTIETPPVAEEQPVRKKRRSKAEIEAAAKAPEPDHGTLVVDTTVTVPPEEPEYPTSEGVTYWINNEQPSVFVLQDGENLPDQGAIDEGIIEQLTDEAEYQHMKRRVEQLAAEAAKGPAAALEAEVEAELEIDTDALMEAATAFLDAFGDEVEGSARVKGIIQQVGKADRLRDIEPERHRAVYDALNAATEAHKAGKKGKR